MPVTTSKTSQEEPVLFQVNRLEPSPLPAPLSQPGEFLLSIHRVDNSQKHNFSLRLQQITPYLEAIQQAIQTQDVYWVNWHYPEHEQWSPKQSDTTIDRLLKAVLDGQVVTPEDQLVDAE